jgi:phospholipase D1/2
VFGAFPGAPYALGGSVLNAGVTYGMGRLLGRDTIRRLAGSRLNLVTVKLATKGMLAIAVLRLLPLAPFCIVNAVAGASHVGFANFRRGRRPSRPRNVPWHH